MSAAINLDGALAVFFVESRDLLAGMEQGLQALAGETDAREQLNAIFRAAHTIKGSAGIFGLADIVHFTHAVETFLTQARDGGLALAAPALATLLDCHDHLNDLIDKAEGGEAVDDAARAAGEALIGALSRLSGGASQPAGRDGAPSGRADKAHEPHEAGARDAPGADSPADAVDAAGDTVAAATWHISVRFAPAVLRNGMDPAGIIRYLGTLGELVHIVGLPDAMPDAETMDPRDCHIGFEIDLDTDADKRTIEDAFEFVRDDCQLHILPPHSRIADYVALIAGQDDGPGRLGEILVAAGALTPKELAQAMEMQRRSQPPGERPLGEILVAEQRVAQPVVDAALQRQKSERLRHAGEGFVRVQADKLDKLINLVSELVIAGASANLTARSRRDAVLQEATSSIVSLVGDIRDSALQLRMVQIGETFNRFNRVVRDVCKELGKEVELVVTGGETELDKSVVEKIGDPLMHLVRNAIDHGIETGEARLARGKPARGRLELKAYHDSGCIVIEVLDDGNGLDGARIRAKAVERGLLAPEQALADDELARLIFEPGFSTAQIVSNISGRGVGMDVVKRNIEALRGSVEVKSSPGAGSRFVIRLPLTLAIIDGFLVGVGHSQYVVPLDLVVECIEVDSDDYRRRGVINLRGEVLPCMRLRDLFAIPEREPARASAVVVRCAGRKTGIVVDRLLGELQTVIKPLGKLLGCSSGISGSTILGSGEVGLILDVPALIRSCTAGSESEPGTPPRQRREGESRAAGQHACAGMAAS
ncbi:MAG: hypothetical protein BGO63_13360 [Candidatus Accumulibacter sp. 66-26]|nr:MAG: hypothetical protein BGO63_13360 [Candidatus Accumulibacter sp. 66-26]